MAMVDSFAYGQANVAYGEALTLQEDHGLSKKGLTLAPDEDGHWEIDGFNYTDLYTQANRAWGSEPDYNSRCWQFQQTLYNNVEAARTIAKGDAATARITFADKIDDYDELRPFASQIVNGTYDASSLAELHNVIAAKYPHLAGDYSSFVAGQTSNSGLVSIDEYAPQIDAFFGLGLREEYAWQEVFAHYASKARAEGQNVVFIGPDGNVITGNPDYNPDYNPQGPAMPQVPPPHVETHTEEEQVDYEDLTPEEQQEAQDQIEQMQQEEEEQHQHELEEAQQTADEVTEGLHSGDMTPEEALAALEGAGINPDEDYIETMEQIAQDEADALAQAQAEAEAANQREEEERRRREEQEREEEERRRQEEEALINGQNPEQPQDPVQPEDPAQPEENPDIDPEIDPDHHEEDEQPYTGDSKTVQDLKELRAMALELGDFGMAEDVGRSYTL